MAGKPGKYVSVQSLKNQAVIADKCFVAERFLDRLKGLLGKQGLSSGEGMWLRPCNDIHMWFMRFPIDVVFVRPEKKPDGSQVWRVSSAHENIRPWRVLPLRDGKAKETLELPTGTIRQHAIVAGDELCIS